jgi:sulfur carrier protein
MHDRQDTVTAPIAVTINGQARQLPAMTLAQWVEHSGVAAQSVATAVNGEFIARDARTHCQLRDGDAVMTFQAIEGG